jgi:hypothetical protein
VLVGLIVSSAATGHAQSAPAREQGGIAFVSGRVETPGREKQLPVPNVMVTVHRVGSDSSGALDSVRTDAEGRYSLRYRKFGDDAAIYFAAAVYRGIAYFSAPLQSARAQGEEAEITVFDTTSKPVQLHVAGHHFVVSSPSPDGSRNIVEVWEISNDTTVTVVGRDSLTAVWKTPAPAGASRFQGGPGDVTASSIVLRGDSVALLSTFGPGVKQISYTYTLPSSSFPLDLSVTQPTSVLEILVEEPLGQVTSASIRPQAAATTQGRTFKRWLGQDVPPGEHVRITVPTSSAGTRTRLLVGLAAGIIAIMVLALVRALRAKRSVVATAPRAPTHEMLVAAIAALDARKERGDTTLDAAEYTAERARLKALLTAQLAAESAPR